MKQNKPSLKKYILNELAKEGYISRDKVWAISKQFGHTDATVERILRPSMSPIKPVKNEKNHIVGYKLDEEYGKMLVSETNETKKEKQDTTTDSNRLSGQSFAGLVQEELPKREVRGLWESVRHNAPLHREVPKCETEIRGQQLNLSL